MSQISTEIEPAGTQQDRPTDSVAQPKAEQRPQYSLRDLFVAMTGVAAAFGLAAWWGPGTLPYSIGLLLALANVTGRLGFFQTKQTRPKCFYVAWGLLLVSLFLPSVQGCQEDMKGWQAALTVAQAEIEGVQSLASQETDAPWYRWAFSLTVYSLLNLANILALLSPLLLYRLQRDRGKWMGGALAVCSVAAWSLGWTPGFLVGYYVWCFGFAALLIGYRMSWLTFGLMAAYLPAFALAEWLVEG